MEVSSNDQGDTGGLQTSTEGESHVSIKSDLAPDHASSEGSAHPSDPASSVAQPQNGVESSSTATHMTLANLDHNVVEVKDGYWTAHSAHDGAGTGAAPQPPADGIHAGVGCAASPPTGWLPPVLAASALAVVVATALTIRSLTPSQQLKKLGNYEDRAPIFDF